MAQITLESHVRQAEDVLFRNLDGEAVLVSLASSVYFGLDPVGTRIWELIGQRVRLGDVLERLVDEYEVDRERASRDLVELIDELIANGLVRADDKEQGEQR